MSFAVDYSTKYTLTNKFTGSKLVLGASGSNSSIIMDQPGAGNTAKWFFSKSNFDGFYHMHTLKDGTDKALDVVNDKGAKSINLYLTKTAEVTGQYWRFDAWGDGTFKLTNNFTGLDSHLDVWSDSLGPHLATGSPTGQHWSFAKVEDDDEEEEDEGSKTTTSTTKSSTATATTTATGTNLVSVTTSKTGDSQPGSMSSNAPVPAPDGVRLTTGTIVGVSLAVLAIVIGLVALIAFLLIRRKRHNTPVNPKEPFSPTAAPPAYSSTFPPPQFAYEKIDHAPSPITPVAAAKSKQDFDSYSMVELDAIHTVRRDVAQLPAPDPVPAPVELPDRPYR